uniref:Uncharacterized protein n=1 Tax=Cucumis melo TaxID=3656 RepID=A0A9I9EKL3_CUCME
MDFSNTKGKLVRDVQLNSSSSRELVFDFLWQNNTGKLLFQVFGVEATTLSLYGIAEHEEIMWNAFGSTPSTCELEIFERVNKWGGNNNSEARTYNLPKPPALIPS